MAAQIVAPIRKCRKCKRIRLLADFPSLRRRRGRKRTGEWTTYWDWRCKTCKEDEARARRMGKPRRKIKRRFYDFTLQCWVKECRLCERIKPLSEFALAKAKYPSECKPCHSKRTSKRTPHQKANNAKYALRYYYSNHEENIKKNREKKIKYRDKIIAHQRSPEGRQKACNWSMQRIARLKNAPRIEPIDRSAVIARDNATCYLWCKRKLSEREICLDHVIPLSKGGEHTNANLRVACRSCNARKGPRLLEEMGFHFVAL